MRLLTRQQAAAFDRCNYGGFHVRFLPGCNYEPPCALTERETPSLSFVFPSRGSDEMERAGGQIKFNIYPLSCVLFTAKH